VDTLAQYLDSRLSRGETTFSKAEAMASLGISSSAFLSAAARLRGKSRLVSPRQGFYLILRPEDRGAPDAARWIDPLMRFLGIDYRVSLLRAAAHHGASHQAAMVFQVIVARQQKEIVLGSQRVQFLYQSPDLFAATNRDEWLERIKTEAGYAKVAGVELTLLDAARYLHHCGGLSGVAQLAHDLGGKARPRILSAAAECYESSVVRRLGYLLEQGCHGRQAKELRRFVARDSSLKPLDPSVEPLPGIAVAAPETNDAWRLTINTDVEIDR
jgi:predicted transcriptional regulator of viral defense system